MHKIYRRTLWSGKGVPTWRVKRIFSGVVCVVYLLLPAGSSSQVKSSVPGATQSLKGGRTMNQSKPLTLVKDPMIPVPIPRQMPAEEGMAELSGTGTLAATEHRSCYCIRRRAAL